MEEELKEKVIINCCVYLGDIRILGRNENEHDENFKKSIGQVK